MNGHAAGDFFRKNSGLEALGGVGKRAAAADGLERMAFDLEGPAVWGLAPRKV